MKILLILFSLFILTQALCQNMETYSEYDSNDWTCMACGDNYDCTYTGLSEDFCATYSVPGCTLPNNADIWWCCRNCNPQVVEMCPYETPNSDPSSSNEGQEAKAGSSGYQIGWYIGIGIAVLLIIGTIMIISIYIVTRRSRDYQRIPNSEDNA